MEAAVTNLQFYVNTNRSGTYNRNTLLMSTNNPYETQALTSDGPDKPAHAPIQKGRKWFRWLFASPFLLIGGAWCLLLIRTGERVSEAISRYSEGGGDAIVRDPAFLESLRRVVCLPLIGIGFLLVGFAIIQRKQILGLVGAVWSIVVLFAVDFFIFRLK